MDWFYAKHGKQEGPLSLEELQAKFRSGELAPTDLVWHEGMGAWQAAEAVPEISGSGAVVPAPALESAPSTSGGLPGLGTSVGASPVTGGSAVPQPVAGVGPVAPPATPGLATASLVCGILSLVLSCCGVGFFLGIAAVICGHLQNGNYKKDPGNEQGKGLVTAGLITGYLGIVLSLILGILQILNGVLVSGSSF